jgi:heme A synthase
MILNLALAQSPSPQIQSTALILIIVLLLAAGLVGWLAATVLGFSRARYSPSTRWFALSALCLLIYHVQWIAFGLLGRGETDINRLLSFGSFFNLFVFLGSICAIVGFLRLSSSPRP